MTWSTAVGAARFRLSRGLVSLVCAIALGAAIFATAASAATYTYCNGCTINASDYRMSAATRYAYISYVHRLSGPGSGVLIYAEAYTPGGTLVCSQPSWSTEAACNPARYEVHGVAWNFGAGNYGFNAHLGY